MLYLKIKKGANLLLNRKNMLLVGLALLLTVTFFAIPPIAVAPYQEGIKSGEEAGMGSKGVPSTISLGSNELSKTFTSPVYKARHEFNAIAPHWKETNVLEETRRIEMRTSADGHIWSGWLEVEAIGALRDDDPHPDRIFTENPLFISGRHFQYKLSLNRSSLDAPSPEVTDLKVTYIDSRDNSSQNLLNKLSGIKSRMIAIAKADDQGPRIISRTEWGSPDPYGGLFKGTAKDWSPQGSPVKQVFIHHTVNSNYQSDPAAVVRAIWEFHANTRGWGDIGYNFLIDGSGQIYEGRFGGDNIVGGHVYEYNTGSLGVAVIGCYENSSTCNNLNGGTTTGPSNSVLHGLTELLAWKTTNFEINPQGTQTFCKWNGTSCLNLSTIASHKDAAQTSCPGNLLYDRLGFIRDETSRKKTAYAWAYSAKQESYGTIDLATTDSSSVTLRFKNTGSTTWSNTTNRILLKTANPHNRTSAFQGTGWIDSATPAALNEASVIPGAIGSFTFNLKRPSDATDYYYEAFRLVVEGIGEIKSFYTSQIVTPIFSSAFTAQSVFPIIVQGKSSSVFISYKNTGNVAWHDDSSVLAAPAGTKPVHLGTSHNLDRRSSFGSSWGGDWNRPALNFAAVYESDGITLAADQHVAQPGQIARFSFTLSAPNDLAGGTYREYFQLLVEGRRWMNDVGTYLDVTVEPKRFTSSYKAQSAHPAMFADNTTKILWLEYHNSGNQPWYDDISLSSAPAGTKPVHLATSHSFNRRSSFGSSWGGDWNRPALNFAAVYRADGSLYPTNPHIVEPGEAARFEFVVSAPFDLATSTYREYFQLVIEGSSPMNDVGTYLDMTVIPVNYTSAYVSQCNYPTIMRGASTNCSLSYKNTGNVAWHDDSSVLAAPAGTKPVHLGTSHNLDRRSSFGSSWGGDWNRPALNFAAVYESDGITLAADQHVAQPGQIARFSFTLSAPNDLAGGTYREYFQLLVEGRRWMNDVGTYLDVTVE